MFHMNAPLTGDESQIMLYAVICGAAAVVMIGLVAASVIVRKKREQKDKE